MRRRATQAIEERREHAQLVFRIVSAPDAKRLIRTARRLYSSFMASNNRLNGIMLFIAVVAAVATIISIPQVQKLIDGRREQQPAGVAAAAPPSQTANTPAPAVERAAPPKRSHRRIVEANTVAKTPAETPDVAPASEEPAAITSREMDEIRQAIPDPKPYTPPRPAKLADGSYTGRLADGKQGKVCVDTDTGLACADLVSATQFVGGFQGYPVNNPTYYYRGAKVTMNVHDGDAVTITIH